MTVKELIDKLSQLDPNKIVMVGEIPNDHYLTEATNVTVENIRNDNVVVIE